MTYHDGGGHVLNLREDPEHPPTHRAFLFVINQATCADCWHSRHAEPVKTCLGCFPPQPLELVA